MILWPEIYSSRTPKCRFLDVNNDEYEQLPFPEHCGRGIKNPSGRGQNKPRIPFAKSWLWIQCRISPTGSQPARVSTASPFVSWKAEGSGMWPPAARTWDGKELSTLLTPRHHKPRCQPLFHLESTWQQPAVIELNPSFCLKNACAVWKCNYS